MKELVLYHGTYRNFTEPKIQFGKDFRDFGKGFYLAENYMDALNILDGRNGYVNEYKLNLEGLKVLDFNQEEGIVDYLIRNRVFGVEDGYDVVIGATLPNCVGIFKKIRHELREGLVKEEEVLGDKKLREEVEDNLTRSPYQDQILIKTEKGLTQLERVKVNDYNDYDFY